MRIISSIVKSEVVLILLYCDYFALLWLVQKTRASFSTDQIKKHHQSLIAVSLALF